MNKDELVSLLKSLSPDERTALLGQAAPNAIDAQFGALSPIKPRQLTDLTRLPSARDPRPMFRTENYPEFHVTQSRYPALLWHAETGQEITVYSDEEKAAKGPLWTSLPPNRVVDPVEEARAAFEALSAEDQAFVLNFQHQQKLTRVTTALGNLTQSQAEAVLSTEPTKRGRPKKDA